MSNVSLIEQIRRNEHTPVSVNIHKMERDGDGNVVYIGIAIAGALVSDSTQWTIYKILRDGNALSIGMGVANGSWNDRASLVYKQG